MATPTTSMHTHGEGCGHPQVKHGDHFDYLENGRLYDIRQKKATTHSIEVSKENPDQCHQLVCFHKHDGIDLEIPHGDHSDFLHHGRLHHPHADHCDDHGPVEMR